MADRLPFQTLDMIPTLSQQTGIDPALLRQMMEDTAAGGGEGYSVPYGSQRATPLKVEMGEDPEMRRQLAQAMAIRGE